MSPWPGHLCDLKHLTSARSPLGNPAGVTFGQRVSAHRCSVSIGTTSSTTQPSRTSPAPNHLYSIVFCHRSGPPWQPRPSWRWKAPRGGRVVPYLFSHFRIDRLDRHSGRLVLSKWCHSDAIDRQACRLRRNASRLFSLTSLPGGHLTPGTLSAAFPVQLCRRDLGTPAEARATFRLTALSSGMGSS